jgi:hypothetical protein
MIITINGADFSAANIGTLNTYSVYAYIGSGAIYNIPNYVLIDSNINWTISLKNGYSFGEYSITMGDTLITPTITDNTMQIAINNVTENIVITIATIDESGNSDLGYTEITDISSYERLSGFISSENVWNNFNEKYEYIIIPIDGEASLSITGSNAGPCYFAGLTSYNPTLNEPVALSTDSIWNKRLSVSAHATKTYASLPSDIKYLYICTKYNTKEQGPASISIKIKK